MATPKNTTPLILTGDLSVLKSGSTQKNRFELTVIRSDLRKLVQLASIPMLVFILLPIIALLLRTPPKQWLVNIVQPQILQAVGISLSTTLLATLISVILGTPLALALARDYLPFRRIFDTLIDLPTVLPPAVAGIALLMAFGRRGIFGSLLEDMGISIAFTPIAVILAQTFIAASFYIKAASIGFASIDPELEQAAGLDGASGWQTFRYLIIPLSRSALLSGAVMTWARALGEFGATIIFAGNFAGRTQTMPLAIYLGFELNFEIALTLAVILIGFSFMALLLVKRILNQDWM